MHFVPRIIRKIAIKGFDIPPYFYSKTHDRSGNSVLLSFDDGPHEQDTLNVLDILDKYGVKAVFFCVGRYLEQHPEIAEAVVKAGHSLQNHSYSHVSFASISPREAESDIRRCRSLIHALGGRSEVRLFRPPEGLVSIRNLMAARRCGERVVLWNWYYQDIGTDESLWPRKGGLILLNHDWSSQVIESTERVIRHLRSHAYEFLDIENNQRHSSLFA